MAADPTPWAMQQDGDFSELLEWATDIATAPTGGEFRRQLRATPRVSMSFSGTESRPAVSQWLQARVLAAGARWLVPLAYDAYALRQDVAQGDAVLPGIPGIGRFEVGGQIIVCGEDPRAAVVGTVASIAIDGITLSAGIERDITAGSWVMPAYSALAQSGISLSRFTGSAITYAADFTIDVPVDWPADAGPSIYRGLPVLEWLPDWSTDPEDLYERSLQLIDSGQGQAFAYDMPGIASVRRSVSVCASNAGEVSALRSLLYGLAGRAGSIWVPSQAQDMSLAAGVPAGQQHIDVVAAGFAAMGQPINARDIRIHVPGLAPIYRRVTGAAALSGGTVERITLDTPMPATALSANPTISLMAVCRQEADTNRINWWRDGVAMTTLQFRGFKSEL